MNPPIPVCSCRERFVKSRTPFLPAVCGPLHLHLRLRSGTDSPVPRRSFSNSRTSLPVSFEPPHCSIYPQNVAALAGNAYQAQPGKAGPFYVSAAVPVALLTYSLPLLGSARLPFLTVLIPTLIEPALSLAVLRSGHWWVPDTPLPVVLPSSHDHFTCLKSPLAAHCGHLPKRYQRDITPFRRLP